MKKKNVIPGNTERANYNAAKTLKAYLAEIEEDQAFEKFSSLFIVITYAEVKGAIMGAAPRVIQPSDCEI